MVPPSRPTRPSADNGHYAEAWPLDAETWPLDAMTWTPNVETAPAELWPTEEGWREQAPATEDWHKPAGGEEALYALDAVRNSSADEECDDEDKEEVSEEDEEEANVEGS